MKRLQVTSAATLSIALTSLTPIAVYAAERNDPIETVTVIGVTPLTGALVDRDQVAAPVQTATSRDMERSHALDLTSFMSRRMGSVHVNDVQRTPCSRTSTIAATPPRRYWARRKICLFISTACDSISRSAMSSAGT